LFEKIRLNKHNSNHERGREGERDRTSAWGPFGQNLCIRFDLTTWDRPMGVLVGHPWAQGQIYQILSIPYLKIERKYLNTNELQRSLFVRVKINYLHK
jgi:hypothetical protein